MAKDTDMKKRTVTIYIATFALLICLPHFVFMICRGFVDNTNYENRPLYEAPVPGQTPYKEFASSFESFYNDRIPFRNQLIALNNKIAYFVFGDTTGDRVMIGKDEWLFIEDPMQGNAKTNYLGTDILKDDEMKVIADNLVENQRIIENAGMEFVIFLSPNKNRVYSEYMPDYMGEPAEQYQLKALIEYLRENTDLKIVYDYDDIMEAKKYADSEGINVYHKADSHWNNVGAYEGARTLAKALGEELPSIDTLTITPKDNEIADLAGMLHMTDYFLNRENDFEITGYNTNNAEEIAFDISDVIEYKSDAPDDRTIFVVRDSFGEAMAPYFASCFGRVYMKHQNYYNVDTLKQVDPDVVVLESAERGALYALESFNVLKDY